MSDSDNSSGPLIGRKVPLTLTFCQLTTAAQNAFSIFIWSLFFSSEMKAAWPDQNPSRDPDKMDWALHTGHKAEKSFSFRPLSLRFCRVRRHLDNTVIYSFEWAGLWSRFYHTSLLKLPQWDKCTKDRKDRELAVWNIICHKMKQRSDDVLFKATRERNEIRWEGCCVCDVVYQSIKWVRCKWLLLQSGNLIAT